MDVDAEDEELADLHIDFAAGEVDATCASNGGGNGLCCCDGCVDEVFVERCLWKVLLVHFASEWRMGELTFVLCARAWLMASLVM